MIILCIGGPDRAAVPPDNQSLVESGAIRRTRHSCAKPLCSAPPHVSVLLAVDWRGHGD
jgi:hypothetical protein